jgi:PAS domain S-box-containing protein
MPEIPSLRKQFLLIFLPLCVGVIAGALLICHVLIHTELTRMRGDDDERVKLGVAELRANMQAPQQHLMSLPHEAPIRAALEDPTPAHLIGMQNAFVSLLQRNPEYDQARWIDESGQERVRVDKTENPLQPEIVTGPRLQDKSKRDYYTDTRSLPVGEIYISRLDLNVENDKIELPIKPTLRFVTALADRTGKRRGILVINYLAAPMLANLLRVGRSGEPQLMLLDRNGYWMSGAAPADTWGFMYGNAATLAGRNPAVWAKIDTATSGNVLDRSGLWSWSTIDTRHVLAPLRSAYAGPSWRVVMHQPAQAIWAVYRDIGIPAVVICALLLLAFAGLSWLLAVRSKLRQDELEAHIKANAEAQANVRRVVELERAQKASAMLTAIIDSSEDAIISKNLDGIITSWNRGAEKLFGYTADEAIGQAMLLLFPPGREEEERHILEQIRHGETLSHFETVRRTKAGVLIDISATISPILDAAGHVIGASKIARDITEHNRARAELEQHRERLEEMVAQRTAQIGEANQQLHELNDKLGHALEEARAANIAKTQFLANMSHEIRTPMNAVLGFIALVLEGELPGEVRRQLTTAHNAAKSLLLLINDILDVSKLQSKKLELEHVSFNLAELLEDSLDMLRIKAQEKGLTLTLHYPSGVQLNYVGDPMRIRQIVTNIAGNAIKFTDSGHVTVSVAAERIPDLVHITFADTGIGMSAEQVERAFQPFAQADASTSRRYGGTGLGLTICSQLVQIMGGRIWVDSELGRGSEFHVVLRLEPSGGESNISVQTYTSDTPIHAARRFRILMVDDIQENCELAQIRLTQQGHSVMLAQNGQEAIALFQQHAFDVVLMDVHMPVMNGLEATREIRRLEQAGGRAERISIVALTASVMAQQRHQCEAAGMTAFIAKPIDFGELARVMEAVVPAGRGTPMDPASETPPVLPAEAFSSSTPADVLDIQAGVLRWRDVARYKAGLASFGQHYGDAAGRLLQLYRAGNWQEAHALAHAVKGVAGNLALPAVAAIASELTDAFLLHQDHDIDARLQRLDLEMAHAMTAIVDYTRDHAATPSHVEAPIQIDHHRMLQGLESLRTALESDDPSQIEPVFDQLAPGLPTSDRAYLGGLIREFEFQSARDWVERSTLAIAQALAADRVEQA